MADAGLQPGCVWLQSLCFPLHLLPLPDAFPEYFHFSFYGHSYLEAFQHLYMCFKTAYIFLIGFLLPKPLNGAHIWSITGSTFITNTVSTSLCIAFG